MSAEEDARAPAREESSPADRAVLEARARLLARRPADVSSAPELELTVFTILGEAYAIESRFLREVIRVTDLTPVPGLPDPLAGVTNLRGEILAVFDTSRLFGLLAGGIADRSRLLVVGLEHPELGLLVDAVREVRRVRESDLVAAPAGIGDAVRELGRGVTRDGVLVIDGERLLADPRLFVEEPETTAPWVEGGGR